MFSNRLRSRSLTAKILYHGTPNDFADLTPQPNKRIKGKIIEWSGEAIFATQDFRIALNYTANKLPSSLNITCGVDLRTPQAPNEPLTILIIGGNTREEALDALFGNINQPASCTGYIYHVDGAHFKTDNGLAVNERISNDSSSVIYRQTINRRETLDRFVAQRQIMIGWVPNLNLNQTAETSTAIRPKK